MKFSKFFLVISLIFMPNLLKSMNVGGFLKGSWAFVFRQGSQEKNSLLMNGLPKTGETFHFESDDPQTDPISAQYEKLKNNEEQEDEFDKTTCCACLKACFKKKEQACPTRLHQNDL
ncbi:hypothetical protein KBC04_00545 [Candidatus Babeliales bacterium]|nr:hypothetical protein [Candidatus Babeliales bacterium]MBP9843420.1 hypothetical protein [Candidatus Babeliales bacterium]